MFCLTATVVSPLSPRYSWSATPGVELGNRDFAVVRPYPDHRSQSGPSPLIQRVTVAPREGLFSIRRLAAGGWGQARSSRKVRATADLLCPHAVPWATATGLRAVLGVSVHSLDPRPWLHLARSSRSSSGERLTGAHHVAHQRLEIPAIVRIAQRPRYGGRSRSVSTTAQTRSAPG
jgi:hypothetical protein